MLPAPGQEYCNPRKQSIKHGQPSASAGHEKGPRGRHRQYCENQQSNQQSLSKEGRCDNHRLSAERSDSIALLCSHDRRCQRALRGQLPVRQRHRSSHADWRGLEPQSNQLGVGLGHNSNHQVARRNSPQSQTLSNQCGATFPESSGPGIWVPGASF